MKKSLVVLLVFALFLNFGCKKENEKKEVYNFAPSVKIQAAQSGSPYVSQIKSLRCAKNSLILVQFNGLNFGKSKSAEELDFMSKMFRDVDLIAIEEVSTDGTGAKAVYLLKDFLNRTGNKWLCSVSDPTHKSSKMEKFGFLWKDSRVQAVRDKAVLISSLSGDLMREPAKMTFRVDGKIFDLFSFHLVTTKDKPINEAEALGRNPEIFSANNVFVVGDFNLGHKKLDKIFEDQLGFKYQIEGRTSLKNKVDKGNYYKNEYDNIYVRGNITICQAGILDFVPSFSDLHSAKQISDHLPVFVEFVLN